MTHNAVVLLTQSLLEKDVLRYGIPSRSGNNKAHVKNSYVFFVCMIYLMLYHMEERWQMRLVVKVIIFHLYFINSLNKHVYVCLYRLFRLITVCQGVNIPSKLNSTKKMLHLLNEAVFLVSQSFNSRIDMAFKRKFWKNGRYIKAPQGREHCSAERLVELYSLTVVLTVVRRRKSHHCVVVQNIAS